MTLADETQTYDALTVETVDGVRHVTLNRPHRLNALSQALIGELAAVLDTTEADDGVRVVTLTGAPRPDGRPCFCAGADLKELAAGGATAVGEREHDLVREVGGVGGADHLGSQGFRLVLGRIETFPKPVLAAIDGPCTAGGLELALSCDLRIVAPTAQMSDLHVTNVHHTGGGGATSRLSRLVGASKAKEMIFLGSTVDGAEAVRIGLANVLAPEGRLGETVHELGAEIARRHPIALRLAKTLADAAHDMARDQALRYDYLCWTAQMLTTGAYAGAQSFAESRRGDGP
jgi:enoyl-CoA hydratase/carnithine racemase